jgi:translation initiation factor 2 beta subunit (eIF-2beta)/eIF-5
MPIRGGTIINIAGTTPVDDPEYRYRMPAVFGKIEGSGNGIKTAIPNISSVAISLHRNPGEVNKFFGCELGAQTTYAEETDRAIVNGAHTDDALQALMHRYIEGFVLCPNCKLVSRCWLGKTLRIPYRFSRRFYRRLLGYIGCVSAVLLTGWFCKSSLERISLKRNTRSRTVVFGRNAPPVAPRKWSI